MPHPEEESLAFIYESRFAIDQLFQTLEHYQNESKKIDKKIKVKFAQSFENLPFINRDQWSVSANYHYLRYQDQLNQLQKGMEVEKLQQIQEFLDRIEATEESIAILAGAVLQIGKQVLSFRYASKPQLQDVRFIGSQSVVELIWEGRNHALHWEEYHPREPVQKMLQKLQDDQGIKIVDAQNNAFAILDALDALEWSDTDVVIEELKVLVKATS